MLKRNDLAKQFELVVQQEIINHNRAVEVTNSSLEELRDQLRRQSQRSDDIVASSLNSVKRLEIQLENLKESLEEIARVLTSKISLNADKTDKHNSILELVKGSLEKATGSFLALTTEIANVKSEQKTLRFKIDDLASEVYERLNRFSDDFYKAIEKSEKSILDRPSEAKQVKQDIEMHLAEKDVDIQGYTKELAIVKRSHFIMEKQIENLYTLIERLNKKDSQ